MYKTLNYIFSSHKNKIKLPENRKIYVLKHFHECRKKYVNIMPIYQTDENSSL